MSRLVATLALLLVACQGASDPAPSDEATRPVRPPKTVVDYRLTVSNKTGIDLVPYKVVEAGPKPYREADPANTLRPNGEAVLDVDGHNVIYLHEPSMMGVMIQLSLRQNPPLLRVMVRKHFAPLGAGGPDTLPEILHERSFHPETTDLRLTLGPLEKDIPVSLE